METKFLSNNGANIMYRVDTRRPTIVYLHGATNNHTMLLNQIRYFYQKGYGFIAPDLRGHGKSTMSMHEDFYTITNFEDDILKMMQAEKIDDAIFVGFSMGGMIAQHFAANHPEKVSGLVLISATYDHIKTFPRTNVRKIALKLSPAYNKMIDAYNKASQMINKTTEFYPDFTSNKYKDLRQRDFPWVIYKEMPTWCRKTANVRDKAVRKWDTFSILPDIQAPTLILHGGHDFLIPKQTAYEMSMMIPNALDPIVIPFAHHAVPIQKPERVNHEIEKFLENLNLG